MFSLSLCPEQANIGSRAHRRSSVKGVAKLLENRESKESQNCEGNGRRGAGETVVARIWLSLRGSFQDRLASSLRPQWSYFSFFFRCVSCFVHDEVGVKSPAVAAGVWPARSRLQCVRPLRGEGVKSVVSNSEC